MAKSIEDALRAARLAEKEAGWRIVQAAEGFVSGVRAKLACTKGQGTTEYAIIVGVLVVIAILAITLFKPKIEELWNAIASGINGL